MVYGMGFIHLLLGIDIVYSADCTFNLSHFQVGIEGLVVGTPREVIDILVRKCWSNALWDHRADARRIKAVFKYHHCG